MSKFDCSSPLQLPLLPHAGMVAGYQLGFAASASKAVHAQEAANPDSPATAHGMGRQQSQQCLPGGTAAQSQRAGRVARIQHAYTAAVGDERCAHTHAGVAVANAHAAAAAADGSATNAVAVGRRNARYVMIWAWHAIVCAGIGQHMHMHT